MLSFQPPRAYLVQDIASDFVDQPVTSRCDKSNSGSIGVSHVAAKPQSSTYDSHAPKIDVLPPFFNQENPIPFFIDNCFLSFVFQEHISAGR